MEKPRIVITGIGVVAPNGIGKDEFWANCAAGVSGIKPITLFDVSKYRCRYAGEISNFQPAKYLGPKGLRNLDRTTLLALVAAKLAIEDAKLDITDANRNDIGVVLGSTMGSVHSISEFDKEGLREGPRYVNPAQFPNTVINSPASQVAIRFGACGVNATISTGFSASLDAVGYALDTLGLGRVRWMIAGGAEELCIQTFLGFQKLGFLAPAANGAAPAPAPYAAGSPGTILGEGAALFVLETAESARERGARVHAEVTAYETAFQPRRIQRRAPESGTLEAVVRTTLSRAGLRPEDVGLIAGCASAEPLLDAIELGAVKAVFGGLPAGPRVECVKRLVGETFSASAAFQVAAALGPISAGALDRPAAGTALVPSFGPPGNSSAAVLAEVRSQ
jgi:3-oxoacyl-[acyl-carrier-protein] synthase II